MKQYLIDTYNFTEEDAVEIENQYKLISLSNNSNITIDEFVKKFLISPPEINL